MKYDWLNYLAMNVSETILFFLKQTSIFTSDKTERVVKFISKICSLEASLYIYPTRKKWLVKKTSVNIKSMSIWHIDVDSIWFDIFSTVISH